MKPYKNFIILIVEYGLMKPYKNYLILIVEYGLMKPYKNYLILMVDYRFWSVRLFVDVDFNPCIYHKYKLFVTCLFVLILEL
jgi:hypothetical protein